MPFYYVVGGRPVCQQETWLVHEDVHQPQNLDIQVMQATAENRPLHVGPLFLTKQTHFPAGQKCRSLLRRFLFNGSGKLLTISKNKPILTQKGLAKFADLSILVNWTGQFARPRAVGHQPYGACN